jgi:hypothetical protein
MSEFNENILEVGDYITDDLRYGSDYYVKQLVEGKIIVDKVCVNPTDADKDIVWNGLYQKLGRTVGEYDTLICGPSTVKEPIGRVYIEVTHNKGEVGGWAIMHSVYENVPFDINEFLRKVIEMKINTREGTVKTLREGAGALIRTKPANLNSIDLKEYTIKISMTDY